MIESIKAVYQDGKLALQQLSCCDRTCIIVSNIMILFELGDQISDIAYVIDTWYQFPSVQLRNLSVFFCFYETFVIAVLFWIVDLMAFYDDDDNQDQQYGCLKKIGYSMLCLILFPFYVLYSIFKINQVIFKVILPNFAQGADPNKKPRSYQKVARDLIECSNKLDPDWVGGRNWKADPDQKVDRNASIDQLKEYSEVLVLFVVAEVLLQSIPELIIQFATNHRIGEWSKIAILSVIFSFIIAIGAIFQVLKEWYLNYKKRQQEWRSQKQIKTIQLCEGFFQNKGMKIGLIILLYFIIWGIIAAIAIHNWSINAELLALVFFTFIVAFVSTIVVFILFIIYVRIDERRTRRFNT